MRRPEQRRVAAGIAGAGLAIGAAGIGAVAAGPPTPVAAASGIVRAAALPARCQPSPVGPPFQLGVVLVVANGTLTAGPVSVDGIGATACGVFTLTQGPPGCPATGTLLVPREGQHFAPVTGTLSLVPGQPLAVPITIVPNDITGTVGCGSSVSGLTATVQVSVQATVQVFGVTCSIGPQAVSVTTTLGVPGTLPSPPSFGDIPGSLKASIPLPGAAVSPTCPAGVAGNLDTLAGLPTTGQLDLPVTAGLDQAGGSST